MGESVYRKIRKILEKPEVPAHIRQRGYEVTIPWHRQLWDAIRPPSASGTHRPMTRRQRRMVWLTLAALAAGGAGSSIYIYRAGAPLRAAKDSNDALRLQYSGRYRDAIAKFTDALATHIDAHTYLLRGNAYNDLGQNGEALGDWDRAIELDPTFADAFTARGTYYRQKGDNDRALADLNESLRIHSSLDAYYQRGQVYAALGQFDKAIADYDQAIELRRESPYVYAARALARRAVGDEAGYAEDHQRGLEPQK